MQADPGKKQWKPQWNKLILFMINKYRNVMQKFCDKKHDLDLDL